MTADRGVGVAGGGKKQNSHDIDGKKKVTIPQEQGWPLHTVFYRDGTTEASNGQSHVGGRCEGKEFRNNWVEGEAKRGRPHGVWLVWRM